MNEHRPLILGCDDHRLLSEIFDELSASVGHNYILASQPTDLLKIIKSSNPTLVIISYNNNQQVIDRISQFFGNVKIPILCLLRKGDHKILTWNDQDIVFTHSLDSSQTAENLSLRIKSLLLLIQNSKKTKCYKYNSIGKDKNIISGNGNLVRYVMELDKKNRSLLNIKKKIKQLYFSVDSTVKKSLISIVNSIKSSDDEKLLWDDFRLHFENINPLFIKQLSSIHPSLTPLDIKYCCFLKMNLSTDEIRCIFGISQESVRTHKYRLKKKLNLLKEQDLLSYIISFPISERLETA